MIGQQSIPLEQRYRRLEMTNRWVAAVAVVAAALAIALGAWMLASQSATRDAQSTIEAVTAAWTAADADLMADVYADDAVLVSGTYEFRGLERIQALLPESAASGFTPELAGQVVEYGDTIAAPIRFTWDDGSEEYAVSIFRLDDAGLIVYHEDFAATMPAD